MASKSKFLIIDGYGILFRSYFAMGDLKTAGGTPIGAIYMSVKTILGLLNRDDYDFVVIALDSGSKTFRTEIYSEYKSNRKEPPESLKPQFDIFDEAIAALGIANLRVSGFEADDIIATYVKMAKLGKKAICKNKPIGDIDEVADDAVDITIASSDKDLMQLTCDNVCMYDSAKKIVLWADDVVEKMGVKPSQVLDFLSLVGDSSDNIPGAFGIGKRTAVKLISQYNSVDEIYTNIESVKPASVADKLIKSKENVFMSKRLAALRDDVEIPDIDISFNGVNNNTLKEFGIKYDFKFISDGNPRKPRGGANNAIGGGKPTMHDKKNLKKEISQESLF